MVDSPSDRHLSERGPGLAEQVAGVLTRAIHTGKLKAGQRLPTEAALGERHEVSRSVVREAISMLRNAGLVVSRRGSGTFVAEAPTVSLVQALPGGSLASVLHLLELRRALEGEAAFHAATRCSRAQLRRLRNAMVDIDEAVEAGESGVEQDLAFHRAIAEASNNEYFITVLDFYNRFLHQAISLTRSNEARRDTFVAEVISEHDAMIEAIASGDGDAARQAAWWHMDQARRRLSDIPPSLIEAFEHARDGGQD
ncbi:FadR/GntR family transcriptional regulator [Kushneria marisflavi]|uniref:GntR family transcriptional regulator n=1 Tax=Kushneria marisflavi TaxID=157779 RepID=A0A240UM25_9GAMM|nr:FadR/GntR family transcriptional regulator [Kushneria marisflavi]ART62092.1 GntR family transcriptional regulator [Kushneria marisflavi]RKD87165.1 GntR family transcriptional regulator [Kushneria marisflavi]